MNRDDPGGRPRWHSVPLMWLVVAVPALAVAGGLVTLFVALRGADVVVRDDFRREGLAIYLDPARDAAAAEAGAQARLEFDRAAHRVRATLTLDGVLPPDRLLLLLSHATRAELDRMIELRNGAGPYEGALEPLPPGHWHLELTPPNRAWRLRGEFHGPQPVVELEAARSR